MSLMFQFCQTKQATPAALAEKDSLSSEITKLKAEINRLSEAPSLDSCLLRGDTLTGSFTEAFLADCFHLSFKDLNGKTWNFDNPDNIYGMDILDISGELKLKEGISSRTFKIWFARLKGIDCESSDSYHEQKNRKYVLMPTILKVEEVF